MPLPSLISREKLSDQAQKSVERQTQAVRDGCLCYDLPVLVQALVLVLVCAENSAVLTEC